MDRILIGAVIVIALALGAAHFMRKEAPPARNAGNEPAQTGGGNGRVAEAQNIKLYYYNEKNDRDESGTVLCGKGGLVAVARTIPPTQTPLKDALQLLLKGELTPAERARGISTEFPLAGVALKSASIAGGVATLTLDDPQRKTSGGSCRTFILSAQITATAEQFPAVQSVRLMPEELFQP